MAGRAPTTNGSLSPLAKSPPHNPKTIEYASSAPVPSSSKHAQDGTEDEDIPTHLYSKLPAHYLENGVPDYLRMILMCTLKQRG
jgi:threonine dehydratase